MSTAPSPSYGYCPTCSAPGAHRERRPGGNDMCRQGHTYPSASALTAPVAARGASSLERELRLIVGSLFADGRFDSAGIRVTEHEVVVSLALFCGEQIVSIAEVFVPQSDARYHWPDYVRDRVDDAVRKLEFKAGPRR